VTALRIIPERPARTRAGRSGQRAGGARTAPSAGRRAWVLFQRAVLAVAVALLLVLAILPRLGLYRPVTVLSGSMRPTFSPGDMVFVVPESVASVHVGQVISYRVPVGIHQVETHRVVKLLNGAGGPHPVVQTQGDANNHVDPWTARLEGATAWRQVAVVPALGYAVSALRAPQVRVAAVLIAPAFLLLLALTEIWGLGFGRRATQEPAIAQAS
jgi:signal peptidase